jgi:NADH dehydrogenase FAD-containing subunit
MSDVRNIVILGASIAGLSAAHYFLRHIHPQLPQVEGVLYRVVLVDPSSKFYWRPGTPRATASDRLGPDASIFLDYQQAFRAYGEKITLVHGAATFWDSEKRVIDVKKSDGSKTVLSYHSLILATGSRSPSPLHSLQGSDYMEVQAALHTVRKELPTAKRIIVAGGGPTGVETAGEIAEVLNGRAGWFSSRPSNGKIEVVLLTSAERLLPLLRPEIASRAETYLNRVGVDVRYQTRIEESEKLDTGKTRIVLHGGEVVIADIYIPAMGMVPNTAYAPKHLLDSDGCIKMNKRTLRVDDAGPLVYALGDVGSYSKKGIVDVLMGLPVLGTNMKRDLIAAHGNPAQKPAGPDRILAPFDPETQLLPVGQSYGVGAVFGWRLPDLLIWLLKGGHMKAHGGQEWVDGARWKSPEWIVSSLTKTWETVA